MQLEEEKNKNRGSNSNLSTLKFVLVVSLSINIFVLSSLAMYGMWIVTGWLLSTFWRGIASLFVWIATFGAGAVSFWKIIERYSTTTTNGATESSSAKGGSVRL